MPIQSISFLIRAQDHFSETFRRMDQEMRGVKKRMEEVNSRFGKMGEKMKELGASRFLAAGVGTFLGTELVKKAIDAGDEALNNIQRIKGAFPGNIKLAKQFVGMLEEMGDKSILPVKSTVDLGIALKQIGFSVKNVKSSLKDMQDIAAANNGSLDQFRTIATQMSSGRGGEALLQLMRQYGVTLKQLGITSTKQAQNLTKSQIIAALHHYVMSAHIQGYARHAHDLGQALIKLNHQVDEVFESLGKGIAGPGTTFTQAIIKLTAKVKSFAGWLGKLPRAWKIVIVGMLAAIPVLTAIGVTSWAVTSSFGAMAGILKILKFSFIGALKAVRLFGIAFNFLTDTNPVLLAISVSILAVAGVTYLLIKHWTTVKHAVVSAVKSIFGYMLKLRNTIANLAQGPMGDLIIVLTGIFNPFLAVLVLIIRHFDSIKRAAVDAAHFISHAVGSAEHFFGFGEQGKVTSHDLRHSVIMNHARPQTTSINGNMTVQVIGHDGRPMQGKIVHNSFNLGANLG